MIKISSLIIMFILFAGKGFCQDSLAFKLIVKNVVVPKDQIVLDSISNGSYFFSGVATFDLESSLASINLHVFLAEVPFKRYRIMNEIGIGENIFSGNAQFRKIDSLCTGDVGLIKPKKNCVIYWRYSTKNRKNHCQIKIGAGNYYYANTKTEVTSITRGILAGKQEFWYNNLGLLLKSQENALDNGKPFVIVKVPKYTNDGQVLVDDTTDPFVKNAYDNQSRAVFRQEAIASGYKVNFIFGYLYDSLSRAVQRQHLLFGATSAQPGAPFNIEYITYDDHDRIAFYEINFCFVNFVCRNPYDSIAGKETMKYFYGNGNSTLADSIVRDFFDKNRNYRLVSRIAEKYLYRPDSLIKEDVSISKGYDDSGTCWGSQFYQEGKTIYQYDAMKYVFRYDSWARNSLDSSLKPVPELCLGYRREYDALGNTIKQFDFCDQDETLLWKAQYNKFNFIIQQTGYGISDTTVANYQWDLLDLDNQKEFLHE